MFILLLVAGFAIVVLTVTVVLLAKAGGYFE
jgi:hypothetical protein